MSRSGDEITRLYARVAQLERELAAAKSGTKRTYADVYTENHNLAIDRIRHAIESDSTWVDEAYTRRALVSAVLAQAAATMSVSNRIIEATNNVLQAFRAIKEDK